MKVIYVDSNPDFKGEMNAEKTDFLVDPFIRKSAEGSDYNQILKDNAICPIDVCYVEE